MGRTVEKCTEIEAGRGTRDETHPRHRLLRDNSRTERVEPPRLLPIQDVPQQPSQPQPSASLSPLSSLLSPLSSLLSPLSSLLPRLLPSFSHSTHRESRKRDVQSLSSSLLRPPSDPLLVLPPPPTSSPTSSLALALLILLIRRSHVHPPTKVVRSDQLRIAHVIGLVQCAGEVASGSGGGGGSWSFAFLLRGGGGAVWVGFGDGGGESEGVGGAGGGGWHDAGEGLSGRRGEKKERSEGEGNRGDENVRGGCGVLKSALLRFFLLSCSIIIRLSCWPRSTTWGILSILSQGRGQRKARFAPEDH